MVVSSTNACQCCRLLRADDNSNVGWRMLVFVLNIFLTPVLLAYHSVVTYVLPCWFSIAGSCCIGVLQCNSSFFSWLQFTDSSFPPNDESLGKLQARPANIRWVRLPDLVKKGENKRPMLFDDTIVATDVCQGALGDCWLLAAFATLCERKTFIQNCFVTRCYNPRGKYVIRLYDQATKGFYNVTVDDYIPCDAHNRPLFTQFNGQEMWPLLLEKAYAKAKGSYAAIEGGRPLTAMIELTGCLGDTFVGPFDDKDFTRLQKCFRKGCLLAAGSRGTDNTRVVGRDKVKSAIVGGHAYSIMNIKTPMLTTQNIRLLRIRNPWGAFEWDGDWSDNSPLWKKHTGVALEIGKPEEKEDGIFYMSWEDFIRLFNTVDVLYPSYGVRDIHYRVVETDPYCGTCRGCFWGCLKYWLCLKGLRTLWFEQSSAELKAALDKDKDEGSRMLSLV